MQIEFKKQADGTSLLRCIRDDGSVTWQRHRLARAAFFPYHDLAHFAVETILAETEGFYGLIARGWEIAETTGKTARGPIPLRALALEHLVGILDGERAAGQDWTAAEINPHTHVFARERELPAPSPLNEDTLARIRGLIIDLHGRWRALPFGETMELTFSR